MKGATGWLDVDEKLGAGFKTSTITLAGSVIYPRR
jgi:hypothetical protein